MNQNRAEQLLKAEQSLVERIRRGDRRAWSQLIEQYEGRLTAYVVSRIGDYAAAEDLVQETFVGFLVSLPNYRPQESRLETFLFSIATNKVRDYLRRVGRRPEVRLVPRGTDTSTGWSRVEGDARTASSLVRSRESRSRREEVLGRCLGELVRRWLAKGEFERLQCAELLFVRGWPNKRVAQELGLSEQAVANHKHFILSKLRQAARRAGLAVSDIREFQERDG